MKKVLNTKYIFVSIIIIASILRLYKIALVPPSLFGDELDLGYQAYSILKTGHDYRGNFLPLNFHSLAEWRTPLYLYAAVPTVAVFGITPLGVRLPAAIFGILSVVMMFLITKKLLSFKTNYSGDAPALISSFLMAISPWSLQYSRAGFEVTLMLFLLLLGLYIFFKSLEESNYLWLSVLFFMLTPLVYSTAKLFTPVVMSVLFFLFKKEIVKMKKQDLINSLIAGLLIGIPVIFSTFFGGGTQRISDISILTDPNMEQSVGAARDLDRKTGTPDFVSKLVNNKYTYFSNKFATNYLSAFSPQFLFLQGDSNMRQSAGGGLFYLIEILPLIFGLGFFFYASDISKKIKYLLLIWLLLAVFPSSLTLNGGTHATRLILMLPVFVFFMSYGWIELYKRVPNQYKNIFVTLALAVYAFSMFFNLHNYYSAYPVLSEKWWHYGWAPAITEIKKIDKNYDRVIISMSGEPAWIFFAANYQYDPLKWQTEFPIGSDLQVDGFGKLSHSGKFYFGSPDSAVQIYGLGKYLNSRDLYLANAAEDGENLITHPERVPDGLKLIKAVSFLSGEPAFYLFSGI